MPIATVTRTVILLDGSIEKTVERLHKDKAGNVIKVLSKTTEIIPSTTGPPTKSSVTPTPALEDPDEDYLVAQLRKRTQHSKRSSSEQDGNNSSALSIHSNGSGIDTGSYPSLDGKKANRGSSHGDSLVDHLRRVSLQNNNSQSSPQVTPATVARPHHSVQHIEESPFPSIMVEAEPIRSDRCTFKTVSKEIVAADGTITVRTEKLKVYPNGSVQVLETRDQVKDTRSNSRPQVVPTQRPHMTVPRGQSSNQTSVIPNLPTRIQTSAVPRPHTTSGPTSAVSSAVPHQTQAPLNPALPIRIQTMAVPQGLPTLPTHLPAVVTRPQPSRPQIIQQDEGQRLETAEDALAFAETAHELLSGGEDDSEGIVFNVNVGGQQQVNAVDPNNIRQALRWGRVGLRAAQLGANILGIDGGALDAGLFEATAEACTALEE